MNFKDIDDIIYNELVHYYNDIDNDEELTEHDYNVIYNNITALYEKIKDALKDTFIGVDDIEKETEQKRQ